MSVFFFIDLRNIQIGLFNLLFFLSSIFNFYYLNCVFSKTIYKSGHHGVFEAANETVS